MRALIISLLCLFLLLSSSALAMLKARDGSEKGMVILLHGIGQSQWNMSGVANALEKSGYKTLNIQYPSLQKNIDDLAMHVSEELKRKKVWAEYDKQVHFATHSMGGLVLRTYLNDYKDQIPGDKLGRVVMLAPPHGGSEIADLLHDLSLYKWIYGPAGQDLTTKAQANIDSDIYYELGIIAGDKEWPYIIAAHVIPDKSDGRVALEKTKLEGMQDHITMSATHTFISWKPSVHKQIVSFIDSGQFNRNE